MAVKQGMAGLLLLALLLACAPEETETDERPRDEAAPSGSWAIMSAVPEARTEVSVTTDGERVYMIGGFLPPVDEDSDERPPAATDMFAWSPVEGEWENLGPIPGGTHHAGFVHVDGKLYVVGGYYDNTFDPAGHVWIYDIAADAWSEGTAMPTPRGALAYAVLDGRIHTIGGTVADAAEHDHEGHTTDAPDDSVGTHEVYDPATDSWERLAPMPTARNHHVAKAVDGRVVVTAGRAGRNFTMTETEIYDPSDDSWTEGAPLPTGRSGVAAERLGEWVYVFGGETFDEGAARTFDEVERYHIGLDRWESMPVMPTARHGLGAAVVDEGICVISGGPEPGYSFGTDNECFIPVD
ncbi:Kelch repeat-containing protein [Natronospira bacteriovora]|uniref:Kelch repeat-containing protein n=1 Tax=Natronospira bacteriovora TaxID=3069753 RepID=A0ABU0W4W7_9GAMM|nr:kelch repeat-containing protein [Natronospira sp. AB-CW4]MDQ2068999.1 kelch repeat-containing protein [Natronospira sp. AB-CW4]